MSKKRQQIAKYISCLLLTCLFLGGCGKAEEIPELIDPVSLNQAFRPVERRDIGSPKIMIGHYVPQEYCHFYKKNTTIKEIKCDIGQYVNEGDVLAVADVEKLQEDLEETKAALNLCVAKHEIQPKIHEYTVKSLQSQRSACDYQYDTDGAAKITIQINVENENFSYDEKLFAFMVDHYNEEIADLEEVIQDSTLKARKSGYVTYIKDTSTGNQANMNENIVIVSDYEDTHIEVSGLTIKDYKYKNFDIKYAVVDGEQVPIEEYDYTTQEQIYAKASDNYPNIRFKTVEGKQGKAGDFVILYFVNTARKDVLAVALDSTNSDEKGSYVYVKGEDGNLEKRYYEPGTGDDRYMEVKSGLEEGEMVLYVQEITIPEKYEPYTITLNDYVQTLQAKRYQRAETVNTAYFTPCDGKVKSVLVSEDNKVKKGDTLMVIDSGGGSAQIVEAENNLKHLEQDYIKQCKDLDKQMGDLTEQSLRMITTIEMGGPDGDGSLDEPAIDAINCQRGSLENEVKILGQQKELARLEYEDSLRKMTKAYNDIKKDNNGSGEISIVATDDGMVTKLYVKEGNLVKLNGDNHLLLSCARQNEDKVSVSMTRNADLTGEVGAADVEAGRRLTFSSKDQTFESVCIGSVINNKSYAFTEDGKTYITTCINADDKNKFIASIDDPSFFNEGNMLTDCNVEVEVVRIPKTVTIPGNLLYSEEIKLSKERQNFVWKIVDGEIVKQYVTTGTSYGIGNDTEAVILTGLEEGDVLAEEPTKYKAEESQ